MSDSTTENQVKKLVEERKYEEAKALLKSSYDLNDDQAVEFIKKLEQSAASQSKVIKPGIAAKLAKGCGCFAIFFLLMFVWGVYSMFTSKSDDVEVQGMVVGFFTEESTNSDAKLITYYSPIVLYSYNNKDYRDTLVSVDLSPRYEKDETIKLFIDPAYPAYATDETSMSSSAMYIPYLVFSILSFMAYRYLKRFQFNFKATEIGGVISKLKSAAAQQELNKDSAGIDSGEEYAPGPGWTSTTKTKTKQVSAKGAFGIGTIFLLIGAGFIYANYMAQKRGDRIAAGEIITGTVLSEYRETSSKSTTRYRYTITYDYQGTTGEYKTTHAFDDYNPGDKVELKINPADIDEVAINTDADLYGSSNTFLILIFLGIGGLLIYGGVKMTQKKNSEPAN